MAGPDTNRGAKRAREERARLGLPPAAPIGCVVGVAEEHAEVPVLVARLREGIAGCVWRDGAERLIIVNSSEPVVRRRFTVAHELGHLVCGHDAGEEVTIDTLASMSDHRDPREVQANAFAAELLVPAAAIQECVTSEPDFDELLVLAAHFGVSTTVVLNRCRTLRLVSAERDAHLATCIAEGVERLRAPDLPLARTDDVLGAVATGAVRLPPALAGSALAAVVRGEASVRAAAQASGVPELELARAMEALQLA